MSFLRNNSLPDYIFIDLNMLCMSGHDCLVELKKNPTLSYIPVVIFFTSIDLIDKPETARLGTIDFITKPSKTSDLRSEYFT